MQVNQLKGWRMSCNADEATERLENELGWLRWSNRRVGNTPSIASRTSQLVLQPLRNFTYVTARSPTLPSPHLSHKHFTLFTWRTAHSWGGKVLNIFFKRYYHGSRFIHDITVYTLTWPNLTHLRNRIINLLNSHNVAILNMEGSSLP